MVKSLVSKETFMAVNVYGPTMLILKRDYGITVSVNIKWTI